MNLRDYLNMRRGAAKKLAEHLSISASYLSQLTMGKRRITVMQAVKIENFTQGQVDRRELFPSEWMDIWPELVGNGVRYQFDRQSNVGVCAAQVSPNFRKDDRVQS